MPYSIHVQPSLPIGPRMGLTYVGLEVYVLMVKRAHRWPCFVLQSSSTLLQRLLSPCAPETNETLDPWTRIFILFRGVVIDNTDANIKYSGPRCTDNSGSQDLWGDFEPTMQGTLHGTKANAAPRMPSVVSSLLFIDQRHRFDAIYS